MSSFKGAALGRIATLDDPAGTGKAVPSSPCRSPLDCHSGLAS